MWQEHWPLTMDSRFLSQKDYSKYGLHVITIKMEFGTIYLSLVRIYWWKHLHIKYKLWIYLQSKLGKPPVKMESQHILLYLLLLQVYLPTFQIPQAKSLLCIKALRQAVLQNWPFERIYGLVRVRLHLYTWMKGNQVMDVSHLEEF